MRLRRDRFRPWQRLRLTTLAAVLGLFLVGCGPQPQAPELKGKAVYQNDREGFRLRAPPGWSQHAISRSPAGPVDHEYLLTKYKRLSSDKPAFLHVSVIDLPSGTSPADYLAGNSSPAEWQRQANAESIDLNGMPATRAAFLGNWGGHKVLKEVVAVPRGQRVYFFTGIFPVTDHEAQAQVRAAIGSIVWKDRPNR
jgi:hypothetical protein